MNKYNLVKIIEDFAPLELQEKWDCSGWVVNTAKTDVHKALIALTVTEDVFNQAIKNNCDIIISHHPLFFVPVKYSQIDIYCAHTNADKTDGGTTDTLVKSLGLTAYKSGEFLRISDTEISISEFSNRIRKISPHARLVNNKNVDKISKIAFCAGSGMDLYDEAIQNGCDCFVTGDLKYHSAVEADIVIYDVGHFESEILIKKVFQGLIENETEVCIADETTPFKNI